MNLKKINILLKKVSALREKRNKFEKAAMDLHPMVAASFIPRRLKPGAPTVYYLSASVEGVSRHKYIRKEEVEYWRKRAMEWRRFTKAMSSWVKVNKQMEKMLRLVGKLRREEN